LDRDSQGIVILRKMVKLVIKEKQMKAVQALIPEIHQSEFKKRGMSLILII